MENKHKDLTEILSLSDKELKEVMLEYASKPTVNMRLGHTTFKQIFEASQNELQSRHTNNLITNIQSLSKSIESVADHTHELKEITKLQNESNKELAKKTLIQGILAISISSLALIISITFAYLDFSSDSIWKSEQISTLKSIETNTKKAK